MIEEQYVSFETAKLLKEAGFDVPCRGIYRAYRIGTSVFREYDRKSAKDDLCRNAVDGFQYEYLAPTQALAARWLREVHHIHVFAYYHYPSSKYAYFTECLDVPCAEMGLHYSSIDYDTHEAAIEGGLIETLKTILNCK